MTIVVDTNVLVSALLRPAGPPGVVLDLVLARRARLALDDRIFAEYADVLRRPEFRFPGTTIADLLEHLWRSADRVRAPVLPIALPDPAAAMFVEVGVAALAQALVTGNLRHFPAAQCWGLRVVTPRDAIELVLATGT